MLIYHTAWISGPEEVNFRKNIVGHFSNDLKGHFKVIQVKITKILTFS